MTQGAAGLRGRCLCGAVTFEATHPPKFIVHCHCRWCRRAHGSPIVTWAGVNEDQFRLVGGEPALRWYQSSQRSRRGFCTTCGSTLFFQSTSSPGEMHIAAANIDAGLDVPPAAHVFVDQKVDWLAIGDDLPQIRGDDPRLGAYAD